MFLQILKLYRIPHWLKNFFLFVPLIFAKKIFDLSDFYSALTGFIAFSLTSSIVYVINDIADIKEDKTHPEKKNRPLASGRLKISQAIFSIFPIFFLLIVSLLYTNQKFILLVSVYFVINLFYSFLLKDVVILDLFVIAAGFMLRVIAGAVIINVDISSWLILTTMFLSLFLAAMKRRAEMNLLDGVNELNSRKVLAKYSNTFLDQISTVAAAGIIVCYALYSVSERTINMFNTENLIFTTPFVAFGIFRFMFLIYVNKKGENTLEVIAKDFSMMINLLLYLATVFYVIY